MRTRLGWALSLLGVLVGLLGLAVMLLLGPDSRFSTGPHAIETDGIAIVTAPKVISWTDVQVDILAEVPVRKPVFVGIANSVDVQDFVGRTQRVEVTDFHTRWKIKTREVKGRPNLPGAPTAVDWWIAQSAGLGGASISTQLTDESVSAVILSVGSTNLSGVEVTLAYGVEGGFYKGLGLLLLGVGVIWLGWLLRKGAGRRRDDEAYAEEQTVEDEVVYVYVDEDGVEHEVSADEAQDYEVVDEAGVEPGSAVTSPGVEPAPEPGGPEPAAPEPVAPTPPPGASSIPGVMTAAEIAAEPAPKPEPEPQPEPEPEPEPQPEPQPQSQSQSQPASATPESATPESVVYVFVDEDGVEHEVSADELHEFEILDEEDES